ncbi:flagellar biosynthesis protein FlhB [Gammaproteobacteria bacterium 45_16_T64]|nr:flagellar biosynthesis protein FlhB [Gammaproteobacteria bacterium 45_16_T64]
MAEEDSAQEKTEEPTQKKIDDSRDKGQIPRSKELAAAGIMIFGSLGCLILSGPLIKAITGVFRSSMSLTREEIFDLSFISHKFETSMFSAFSSLGIFFLMLAFIALFVPGLFGGWIFSWKSLAPKMSKMNPIKGLKKIFSANAIMELVKAFSKFVLVGFFGFLALTHYRYELMGLGFEAPKVAIAHGLEILAWCFIFLSTSLLFIAAIDVPFQLFQHNKQMKMTKQEVKDEHKNTEGKPEVKGRIRRMQHEIAQNRMMSAVPDADVVITNPTHYAIALKYDHGTMMAPKLVAKGVDLMAEQIKRVAIEHNVTIVTAPPLARSIYYNTKLEREIPAGLYVSVAQVLAYVYQLTQYTAGQGDNPGNVPDFEVPEDLKRD